jgi:hypothetical protein
VKAGDLVKHKAFNNLGVGLVVEMGGVHCRVQWFFDGASKTPGYEARAMMMVVSDGTSF